MDNEEMSSEESDIVYGTYVPDLDDVSEGLKEFWRKESLRLNEFYKPCTIKCPLRRTIAGKGVASVKRELKKIGQIDINAQDDYGSTYLDTALFFNKWDNLLFLLTLDEADVNVKNKLGDTLITHAFRVHINGIVPDLVFRRILEKNCDLDTRNNRGETPLHQCILSGVEGGTTVEHLCMLLYYNASVNEYDEYDEYSHIHGGYASPFECALWCDHDVMAKIMLDYVATMTCWVPAMTRRIFGCSTILDFALCRKFDIAVDIAERSGKEFFKSKYLPIGLLDDAPNYTEVLRKVWKKIDVLEVYARSKTDWLTKFLSNELFPNDKSLEMLETIFGSKNYKYIGTYKVFNQPTGQYYTQLYSLMSDMNVCDRVKWTYIFLSYGITVLFTDIKYLYRTCGICEEMFAIFSSEVCIEADETKFNLSSRLYIEADETPFILSKILYNSPNILPKKNTDFQYYCAKEQIPSLQQLCRDVCRNRIYLKCNSKLKFGAFNAIMKLNVPLLIKHVLILKQPLYD